MKELDLYDREVSLCEYRITQQPQKISELITIWSHDTRAKKYIDFSDQELAFGSSLAFLLLEEPIGLLTYSEYSDSIELGIYVVPSMRGRKHAVSMILSFINEYGSLSDKYLLYIDRSNTESLEAFNTIAISRKSEGRKVVVEVGGPSERK